MLSHTTFLLLISVRFFHLKEDTRKSDISAFVGRMLGLYRLKRDRISDDGNDSFCLHLSVSMTISVIPPEASGIWL